MEIIPLKYNLNKTNKFLIQHIFDYISGNRQLKLVQSSKYFQKVLQITSYHFKIYSHISKNVATDKLLQDFSKIYLSILEGFSIRKILDYEKAFIFYLKALEGNKINIFIEEINAKLYSFLVNSFKYEKFVFELIIDSRKLSKEKLRRLYELIFKNSNKVSSIFFRNISIDDSFITLLKIRSNTLTSVVLSSNFINKDDTKNIADALKYNSNLTHINLSLNLIGSEGIKYITDVLKDNHTLTSLNLFYNQLQDRGARCIAELLKVNNSITEINLGYNQITGEGAKALAEGIAVNSQLKFINLRTNSINDEGANSILEAYANSRQSLTDIDLSGNTISADLLNEITKAITQK